MDTDLYLSEVFVDNGKAKSDGFDQRGIVRVVQKPVYYEQVRYGSVVQDWNMSAAPSANCEPQTGIPNGQAIPSTETAHKVGATEQQDRHEDQAFNDNPSPVHDTSLAHSPSDDRHQSENLNEWEFSEEDIFNHSDDCFGAEQKSSSDKGKNISVADDSDVDMFKFAGSEEEASKPSRSDKLHKDELRVKPFRETEAEFQRNRAATMGPDEKQLPDSPFKKLLAAKKRQQSEPAKSPVKELKASKHRNNVPTESESDLPHSPFHVQIPVKGVGKIQHDPNGPPQVIAVTPRGREKKRDVMPSKRDGDSYEMASALLPAETSLDIQEQRHSSSRGQKTKESSPADPAFLFSRPSQDRSSGGKINKKPVPPPRSGASFDYPPNFSPQKINEIRDCSAKTTELDAAKRDGAKDDHLKQIETVHNCIANYHNAVEAGRSAKRIEKLRAKWERGNNILKQKAAETNKNKAEYHKQQELKKAAKSSQTSSQPRTITGQFAKRSEQTTPATPQSKLGTSPRSIVKSAGSAQKKPETARRSEPTKRAKDNTGSRSGGTTTVSRTRPRAVSVSSSDHENNDGGNSADVSIVATRARKRLRLSKE